MSCPYPLIRAETHETYRNKKGGISYKAEFIPRIDYDKTKCQNLIKGGVYRKVDLIGCGQCIECKLQYTREWATRCMLEKQYCFNWGTNEEPRYGPYPDNTCWFLTLTYKDEFLPSHQTVNTETGEVIKGMSVKPRDMQLFWKRVRKRKKWKDCKIKYLNVSEYGHQTHRPHNHAIVFGMPLDISKFKKRGINDWGDPYWSTEELDDVWVDEETGLPMGNITIGRVTWRSAAYVARYSLKKILSEQDNTWYQMQGILPEHVSMSDNIGVAYYKDNKEKIYKTDSVPITNPKSGELIKPPHNFDRMFKESDPDLYKMIKDRRKIIAETGQALKMKNTDLTIEEMRKQSAQRMKDVIKDLRKEPN